MKKTSLMVVISVKNDDDPPSDIQEFNFPLLEQFIKEALRREYGYGYEEVDVEVTSISRPRHDMADGRHPRGTFAWGPI